MNPILPILLLLALSTQVVEAQHHPHPHAAATLTAQQVAECGEDSYFRSYPIDEALFRRIEGLSYKSNCTVPLEELRYLTLLHRDGEGEIRRGEMICNRAVADDLLAIFRELYRASYPIERMVLVDEYGADDNRSMAANNSSSFNFRYIAGTTKLSRHSLGLAVDINPLYNPYVRESDGGVVVEPAESRPYADRDGDFPYKIDSTDLCCRLFVEYGFVWGGDWQSVKDYQHFERAE